MTAQDILDRVHARCNYYEQELLGEEAFKRQWWHLYTGLLHTMTDENIESHKRQIQNWFEHPDLTDRNDSEISDFSARQQVLGEVLALFDE